MSSESIGFLSLPPEIRDEIYYLAAEPEKPIKLYAKMKEDYCDVPGNWTLVWRYSRIRHLNKLKAPFTSLSRVCWQLHQEVSKTFFHHVRVSIDFVNDYDASSSSLVPQLHIRRFRAIEVEKDHQRLDFTLPTVTYRVEICSKLLIEQLPSGSLAVRWTVGYTRGPYRRPLERTRDRLDGLLELLSERNIHVAKRLLGAQTDRLAALQCLLNHVDGRWEEDDVARLIRGTEGVAASMTNDSAAHKSDAGEDESTFPRPPMFHLPANTTIL